MASEVTISMQNIYEEIFVDVREALCGCKNCLRSQPVRPTFDVALIYVALEEHVAALQIYCKQLIPIHFIAVKLTTMLLRARGMDIANVRHRLEFPVDGLSEQLRMQFPDPREVIFDIRVLEVVREIMHETEADTHGNKPVGLTSATPVDYFQDIRPHLVMYADILHAAHSAIVGVHTSSHHLKVINATIKHAPPVVDELAELIREIELEEQKRTPPSKGKKKKNAKKAASVTVPVQVPEKLCAICLDAHVAVMSNVCGHVMLCEDCYDRTDMKKCPMCQTSCAGIIVWPQADERPPACKKCTDMFPNLRCTCGTMTCEPCGPCKCKKGKARKMFWA